MLNSFTASFQELELYNPELVNKHCVLALNKIDIEDSDKKVEAVMEELNNIDGTL